MLDTSSNMHDPVSQSKHLGAFGRESGRLVWPLILLLALAAGCGAWWWKQHQSGNAGPDGSASGAASGASKPFGKGKGKGMRGGFGGDKPVPVRVAAVERRDMDVVIDALGTVTPTGSATVRVRVDGLLQSVQFQEGQLVKAGQVLAQIDPRAFEVALAQAQGQLQRDKALLDNARLDLQRYGDLVKQEAAPRQQLDSQQSLVAQYEGTLKVDQAQVDNARLQLSYTRVTAPTSGRIGLRQVDAGNMVHASDANGLAVINQVQPVSVVFAIAQDQLPAVLAKPTSSLSVQALDRAGSQVLARGQLRSLDNQIDVATGTVKLKAVFANADGTLFPNQFVNTRLQVDRLKAVPTVPEAALLRGAVGSFVYVVGDDNKASVRVIKTGPRSQGRVAVTEGLEPNEKVVVDGTDRLENGSKVEVMTGEGAQAASGAASGAKRRRPAQ